MNVKLQTNQFNVKSLLMTDWHSWQLLVGNGIRIKLGQHNVIKSLMRFIAIYRNLQHKVLIHN
ncbi:hypothetical protein FD727_02355 [Pantoea sp. Mhis]|nr:hypothetical protein [Pantoea sp. Mhis]